MRATRRIPSAARARWRRGLCRASMRRRPIGVSPSRTRPARKGMPRWAPRRRVPAAWRLVCGAALDRERDTRPSPRSPVSDPLLRGAAHAVLAPRHRAVARSLMAVRPPFHRHPLTRRPRHPGRGDGPRRRGGARSGAAARGAARCSTSAGPATGDRRTAGTTAAHRRNGTNDGPPTGGTSRVRKAGSIIVTTNGRTAPGAASGA